MNVLLNYHQDNFFWSNVGSWHVDFRGITSHQMLVVTVSRWRQVATNDLKSEIYCLLLVNPVFPKQKQTIKFSYEP